LVCCCGLAICHFFLLLFKRHLPFAFIIAYGIVRMYKVPATAVQRTDRTTIKPMPQSSWQLKGGHFPQKRKFCASFATSHLGRDLFIIQCTDKPYLVYSVGLRRKYTESLSVGYNYFFFGAHLAQPVQLGCTADFERFWPILGPKFNRISFFLVSGFPLDIAKISGRSDKTV